MRMAADRWDFHLASRIPNLFSRKDNRPERCAHALCPLTFFLATAGLALLSLSELDKGGYPICISPLNQDADHIQCAKYKIGFMGVTGAILLALGAVTGLGAVIAMCIHYAHFEERNSGSNRLIITMGQEEPAVSATDSWHTRLV